MAWRPLRVVSYHLEAQYLELMPRFGSHKQRKMDCKYNTSPSKSEARSGLAGVVLHLRRDQLRRAKTSRTTLQPQFRPHRPYCTWSPLPLPPTVPQRRSLTNLHRGTRHRWSLQPRKSRPAASIISSSVPAPESTVSADIYRLPRLHRCGRTSYLPLGDGSGF